MQQIQIYTCSRFQKEIESEEYSNLDPILIEQFIESFHHSVAIMESALDWNDVLPDNNENTDVENNYTWKKSIGYKTIFDILMVRLIQIIQLDFKY